MAVGVEGIGVAGLLGLKALVWQGIRVEGIVLGLKALM